MLGAHSVRWEEKRKLRPGKIGIPTIISSRDTPQFGRLVQEAKFQKRERKWS